MTFQIVDEDIRKESFEASQSASIATLEAEVKAKNDVLLTALQQCGDDFDLSKIEVVGGSTAKEKSEKLVEVHSKLAGAQDALSAKQQIKKQADAIAARNSGGGDLPDDESGNAPNADLSGQGRTLWNALANHMQDKGLDLDQMRLKDGVSVSLDLGRDVLNTLMKTTAGWSPFSDREDTVILSPQRPIQLTDAIPMRPTQFEKVVYMEETTYTNAAAETAEGASAPEATLALTEREVPVRKITVSLPMTEEQMEDVDEVQGYVEQRIPYMLRQRVDQQLHTGNGTAPNMKGFLDHTGLQSATLARGSGETANKILNLLPEMHKLKTKIMLDGRAMPNAVAIHHELWEGIALQETTAAGYYLGSPSGDFAMRIWGLPVILSDSLSVANGKDSVLMGDFTNFSALRVKRDFTLDWGWSADDFLKGQQRVRGCARMALVVYRPKAFGKLTMPSTGSGII